MNRLVIQFIAMMLLAIPAPPARAAAPADDPAPDSFPGPEIAAPSLWPGVMLIILLASFPTAAMVGLIAKANTEDDA